MTTVFVQAGNDRGLSGGLSREAEASGALPMPPWHSSFSCMWTRWLPTASLQSEARPKAFSGYETGSAISAG